MNNKIHFSSEQDMVKILTHYLKSLNYSLAMEVPNMSQYVDLVGIKGKWVTCIEAKIHSWRRALKQCQAHEIVSDFIYIAIGTQSVSKQFENECFKKGYGIIHCSPISGQCKIYLKAKRNNKYWLPQRKVFIDKLRRAEYAN